ncbi:MAG: hypothetical protein KGL53_15785, partial [Elusimicrobia bacterium]|nr:hypothetical protein [Elusimicrobiota bacterium]
MLRTLLKLAPFAAKAAGRADPAAAQGASGAAFDSIAGSESAPGPGTEAAPAETLPAARGGLLPAPLKASPAEQKALDKVAQDLGPVVAPAQAPELYAVLGTVFARLSAAQQKLFPEDAVSINHMHVVDTPVLNAFVYADKTPGVRRSNNLVFVTTGLLGKLLGADPAGLHEGLVRVAGALAHELAHPLDNIDAEGILTNYGREAGGQAREVRADSEGAMIAKEAGYPAASVYELLKRLFEDAPGGGLARALAGTHPQNDLRLAMQRLLLTLDRYEKGSRAAAYPEAASPAVLSGLAAIDQGEEAGRFSPPKDLAEAVERLRKLPDLKRGEAYKTLEFNRLVLSVDAMLEKEGSELTNDEFARFTEFNRLAAKPGLKLLDRAGMVRTFTPESHSEEFLAYPTHLAFMKRIPAYNSPRYLAWARASFLTKTEDYSATERGLHALLRILPSALVFSAFGDRIAEALPRDMARHPNGRYVYEQSIANGLSVESQVRLAVLFHDKVWPRLTEERRVA